MSYNMRYWWNKGLMKEIQNNLKSHNYSNSQVNGIFNMVKNLYHARLKAFKRVIVFMIVVYVTGLACNIIYIEDKFIAVFSVLIMMVFTFFVMIFAYFNWVVKEKNQFMKCIKIGYPELIEEFGFDGEVS